MKSKPNTISYEEVLPFLKNYVSPIDETEIVSLKEAVGYVLAEDIPCTLDVPAFDNSAMDGWALSSSDIREEPFELVQVGSSFAGHPFEGRLQKGQCVRIMTGGKVPDGADTVVMQEEITATGEQILFPPGIRPGQNVRRQGEEFKKGQVCIGRGVRLHAQHINFLAFLGLSNVCVYRKIRIAFFSTGDELVPIGTSLTEGKIYDSNRYTIDAMIKEAGYECLDLGIVPDNPESLKQVLEKAADSADAIITSGGVSVGTADFTRSVLDEVGRLVDWKCRIKPGKPLAIGKIGETYFFGLPGNPTAAQVTFLVIVSQALKLLSGQGKAELPVLKAIASGAIRKRKGVTEFQRGVLSLENGIPSVALAGSQKTGAMASMINGNCFIYLPETAESVVAGQEVFVVPFFGVC